MRGVCHLEGCEQPVKGTGRYCCPEHASIAVSMRAAGIKTQAEYWAAVKRTRRCPCCGRRLPTAAFRTASADHYSLRLAVTCKDCRKSGKYRTWRAKQSGEVNRRHEGKVIGDDGKARTIHVLSGFLGPALFAGQIVEPRPHGGGGMNTDIRLSVEFWDHPKTLKLQRRLGLEAVVCLQRLWMWAAKNRPEGSLTGMDAEDIELAARWSGDVGVFTPALVDLRWLDQDDASCRIHDWAEHNAWAAAADDRSDHGRLCRMKKTHPSLYKMVTSAGITSGITREQYQELTTSKDPLRTLQGWLKGPLKGDSRVGQAQSPAPAPSPAPKEEDSEGKDPSSSSCAEPEAASPPQPANDSRLICTLPLNDSTDFEVLQSTVDQLRPLYPAVDVVESLKAMKGWLLGDSKRRKTRRGIMRFVTNWLEKDQNRGGGRGRPRDGPPGDIQPRTYAQMQDAERRMMARKALEVIRQEREQNGQYAGDQGAAYQAQCRLPTTQGG